MESTPSIEVPVSRPVTIHAKILSPDQIELEQSYFRIRSNEFVMPNID